MRARGPPAANRGRNRRRTRARAAFGSYPSAGSSAPSCGSGAGGELGSGVDVAKRVGFVVERNFGDRERRIPRVYLATAAAEELLEARPQRPARKREHRMRLRKRAGNGEIDRLRVERSGKPRDEIVRQERRVAGTRRDQRRRRNLEARMQSRERAGVTSDRIGDDR